MLIINLLGDNINTINKNKALIGANKEVGLEVNTEKPKYTLMSPHQNAGQNHNIKTAKGSFENMTKVQTFGKCGITN
jgi:hypothetical protein